MVLFLSLLAQHAPFSASAARSFVVEKPPQENKIIYPQQIQFMDSLSIDTLRQFNVAMEKYNL